MRLYNLSFIILGIISMGIGIIGIALPVLPTTPFLMLASVCFVKGSSKFDFWFRNTRVYKNYVDEFMKSRSMTLKRKIKILMISSLMLIISFISINNIYIRIFIAFLMVFKYYYFVFKIKTDRMK